MPANLNALIRYKQIDKELRNPYLKTTIKNLQTACSEQLAEHRGIYKLISERTIRDDIRIMRSEALGFNAPIIVENGIYSYSDTEYSIFNIAIAGESLLVEILNLLLEEKPNIKSANIDAVIAALKKMLPNKISVENKSIRFENLENRDAQLQHFEISESCFKIDFSSENEEELPPSKLPKLWKVRLPRKKQEIKTAGYTWAHILELI